MTATNEERRENAPPPAVKKTRTGPGALTKIAVAALEDMKAVNVKVMDVRKLTDVTDTMIVATGNSDRHVKSIADRVIERCREAGHRAHGVEGQREGEWVLVDLQDLDRPRHAAAHPRVLRAREALGHAPDPASPSRVT